MDDSTNHAMSADPWSRPSPSQPDGGSDLGSALDPVTGRPTWPPRDPVTGRPTASEPLPPTQPTPVTPPAGAGVYWAASATALPPVAMRPPGRKRRRTALVTGVAILAGLAYKVASGVLVVGVATTALGGLFGGPYRHLPAEYRQGIESRVRTAIPDIDSMSDAEMAKRVPPLVSDGLLRLDDEQVVSYWSALATALDRADTSRCAAVARESIGGRAGSTGSLTSKLPESLDEPTLMSLLNVTVAAIEAGSRQAPARHTVKDAAGTHLVSRVVAGLTPLEIADLGQLDSESVPEDRACATARSLFRTVGTLGPRDEATLVRYLISN
jgi:hypothetical protein